MTAQPSRNHNCNLNRPVVPNPISKSPTFSLVLRAPRCAVGVQGIRTPASAGLPLFVLYLLSCCTRTKESVEGVTGDPDVVREDVQVQEAAPEDMAEAEG